MLEARPGGGLGNDNLIGGAGNDTCLVNGSNDTVWEADTGLPLPLGVIAAERTLADAAGFEDRFRASIAAAWADPETSAAYVRAHAQELDPEVCRRHIALYVNAFSSDLGDEGRAAIETLLARGAAIGMLPRVERVWR